MRIALRSCSNNKLVSAQDQVAGTPTPDRPLVANTASVGAWEQFDVLVQAPDGSWVPYDPAPIPPEPGPTPPDPGPTPPPGRDAFDLAHAVVASPDCPPVAGLAIRSSIAVITLTHAAEGYAMNFPGRDTWPGVTPPGWEGPINHTLWMGLHINGVWSVLPVKEGLHDYLTLGPILAPGQVPQNLTYYAQPPMLGYQPRAGELVGFFCTTGDTRRMNLQPPSGAGRTNVVTVPFQAGTFTWDARRT
jgi:hypothetical protein